MNAKQATKPKEMSADQLRQRIKDLRAERLEVLQQLRLGASTNVRQPSLIRRQIAALMTRLAQLASEPAGAETTKEGK